MKNFSIDNYPSQKGKVAIITGANSGIGFETAKALAKKGATVVMACRNLQKAEEAKKKVLSIDPNASLKPMKIDTSSLTDVQEFAKHFQNHFDRLDFLINNAGIMMSPYKETEDGFENQLATNYIGHFALTGHLIPLLSNTKNSSVITLSSLSYKWADIQFDDLHFQKKYDKKKAYGQSKRACLVFAYELQRRFSEKNMSTKSIAAHPGLSNTNLDRYFNPIIRPLGALFLQKQEKGAYPILFAALDKSLKGGEYVGPDGFQEMRGNPTIVDSDDKTKDRETAKELWKVSEEMTKVSYL